MDDSSSGSSWQTLASVLAGGLGGYVDSQNNQPVYVAQPTPNTAYGAAGYAQATPAASSGSATAPSWLLYAGVAVVAFMLLRK